MNITGLLETYRKLRDSEVKEMGEHVIEPFELFGDTLRTLDYEVFRPISPMLKKRFEFCSSWSNAYLGYKWLSAKQIHHWKNDETLREWVGLRAKNSYEVDCFIKYPTKNIALFAYDPYYPNEMYLVWDEGNIEPKVWMYFDADYYTFNSFERFLLHINGFIGDEDTVRYCV